MVSSSSSSSTTGVPGDGRAAAAPQTMEALMVEFSALETRTVDYGSGLSYSGQMNFLNMFHGQGTLSEQVDVKDAAVFSLPQHRKQRSSKNSAAGSPVGQAPARKRTLWLYKGGFVNGKKHGWGRYISHAGYQYAGQWDTDRMHGYGEEKKTKDRSSYAGQWHSGLKHGVGHSQDEDGSWFAGEWKMGQEDGFGVENSPDVGMYAGRFVRGTYDGYGVIRNTDQQVYAGQWRDAREQGYGVSEKSNGERYEGQWKDGLPHGVGRWYNAQGDEYEGGFQEGYRSGLGIYRRASARGDDLYTVYEGEWVRDRRQGYGTQFSDVGTQYSGKHMHLSVIFL